MNVSDVAVPDPAADSGRLPRGRHGIAAETVVASQQERLLRAVVKVVGERGWSETRIADVVAEAAVSRRTFYELYGGLEACFLAAVEAGFAQLLAAVQAADPVDEGDFEARVRRFFGVYLGLLESAAGATRALHVEMVRATDAIRAQHDRVMELVGEHLLAARFGEGVRDVPDDFGVALVAGFEHLLSRHVRTAEAGASLGALADEATAIAVRALA